MAVDAKWLHVLCDRQTDDLPVDADLNDGAAELLKCQIVCDTQHLAPSTLRHDFLHAAGANLVCYCLLLLVFALALTRLSLPEPLVLPCILVLHFALCCGQAEVHNMQ